MIKPLPVAAQQLTGYIYLVRGNQMPAPGHPVNKGRGVSRDIYIYQPTTAAQTRGASPLFSSIQTKLIAQTKSDSTGHYFIHLPAGNYSVFISDNAGYFAAETNGSGILNPVEIYVNHLTTRDFALNRTAAY